MSLINDALKRAKQAQAQTSPAAPARPALRPVEQMPVERKQFGLMWPAILIVVVGIGIFIVWNRFHTAPLPEAASKVPRNIEIPSSAQPSIEIASPAPPSIKPAAIPPTNTSSVSAKSFPIESTPKEQGETVVFGPVSGGEPSAPVVKPTISNPTNSSVVDKAPVTRTEGPVLKLTGILFHPTHPAAMIGGKTLFVNEKLGEWRVIAIGRDNATLSNSRQTNVLSLAP